VLTFCYFGLTKLAIFLYLNAELLEQLWVDQGQDDHFFEALDVLPASSDVLEVDVQVHLHRIDVGQARADLQAIK